MLQSYHSILYLQCTKVDFNQWNFYEIYLQFEAECGNTANHNTFKYKFNLNSFSLSEVHFYFCLQYRNRIIFAFTFSRVNRKFRILFPLENIVVVEISTLLDWIHSIELTSKYLFKDTDCIIWILPSIRCSSCSNSMYTTTIFLKKCFVYRLLRRSFRIFTFSCMHFICIFLIGRVAFVFSRYCLGVP